MLVKCFPLGDIEPRSLHSIVRFLISQIWARGIMKAAKSYHYVKALFDQWAENNSYTRPERSPTTYTIHKNNGPIERKYCCCRLAHLSGLSEKYLNLMLTCLVELKILNPYDIIFKLPTTSKVDLKYITKSNVTTVRCTKS